MPESHLSMKKRIYFIKTRVFLGEVKHLFMDDMEFDSKVILILKKDVY